MHFVLLPAVALILVSLLMMALPPFAAPLAFALAGLSYLMMGNATLIALRSSVRTHEDMETAIALQNTGAGKALSGFLIVTWPVWYLAPKIIFLARDAANALAGKEPATYP